MFISCDRRPAGEFTLSSELTGARRTWLLGLLYFFSWNARSVAAKLGFATHPHMLRHACGFQLANQGTDTRTLQAYLGHRNIQHTVRYTELSPTRFKNLWRD